MVPAVSVEPGAYQASNPTGSISIAAHERAPTAAFGTA